MCRLLYGGSSFGFLSPPRFSGWQASLSTELLEFLCLEFVEISSLAKLYIRPVGYERVESNWVGAGKRQKMFVRFSVSLALYEKSIAEKSRQWTD